MFIARHKSRAKNQLMKKTVYPLAVAFVIAADQITKYMVRTGMKVGEQIPILGNWFKIYYVQNTGTAFSMFAGNRFVTVVLTSILIIACLTFAYKEHRAGHSLVALLLTFIAAGGISNMIDRLSLGYVTDMISCGNFAVFNVADIFVTCGCILTMIAVFFIYRDEEADKGSENTTAASVSNTANDKKDLKGGSDV